MNLIKRRFFIGLMLLLVGCEQNKFAHFDAALFLNLDSLSTTEWPAKGGLEVTAYGSGFYEGMTLSIGGMEIPDIKVISSTQVTFTSPARVNVLSKELLATNNSELLRSVTLDLLAEVNQQRAPRTETIKFYNFAPVLTSLTPKQGYTTGGETIHLTGLEFVDVKSIQVGGSDCTGLIVLSETSLRCTTPSHSAGLVDVVLLNYDGQTALLPKAYTYVLPPASISNFNPKIVESANPAPIPVNVSLSVTGYQPGDVFKAGASLFTNCAYDQNSQQATCLPPALSAGFYPVTLWRANIQIAQAPQLIEYRDMPRIDSITPNFGTANGGVAIQLSGRHLDKATSFSINGINCVINSKTFLQASCTPGSSPTSGTFPLIMVHPTQGNTVGPSFTYGARPTIVNIMNNSGLITGGVPVTVNGTNFNGPSVSLGGVNCPIVAGSVTATSLRCTPAAHAPGSVSVIVTNADGVSSNSVSYSYLLPPPVLQAMSPNHAPPQGGSVVTLTGTDFYQPMVDFGGTLLNPLSTTSSSITFSVPAGSQGDTVSVRVKNQDGQFSNALVFTYDPYVEIYSINPVAGSPAGGTRLSIFGRGFSADGSVARVGGSICSKQVGTAGMYPTGSLFVCTVPSGTGNVAVTITDGSGHTSLPFQSFHYTTEKEYLKFPDELSGFQAGNSIEGSRAAFVSGQRVYFGATDGNSGAGRGLYIYESNGGLIAKMTTSNSNLASNYVRAIDSGSGRLYVGTNSGLSVSDDEGLTFVTKEVESPNDDIISVKAVGTYVYVINRIPSSGEYHLFMSSDKAENFTHLMALSGTTYGRNSLTLSGGKVYLVDNYDVMGAANSNTIQSAGLGQAMTTLFTFSQPILSRSIYVSNSKILMDSDYQGAQQQWVSNNGGVGFQQVNLQTLGASVSGGAIAGSGSFIYINFNQYVSRSFDGGSTFGESGRSELPVGNILDIFASGSSAYLSYNRDGVYVTNPNFPVTP